MLRTLGLLFIVMTIAVGCSSRRKVAINPIAAAPIETDLVCKSTREYVTTLQYLREKKAFSLSENQAREIADKVSNGCTDASKRFVETTELLLKAEMDSRKVFDYSIKMALATNESSQTFQKIFKEAFVQELLDLDLISALETAYGLSYDFTGSYSDLSNDFNYLVRFCVDQKSLGLPMRDCAAFATRIARISSLTKAPISPSFKKGFDYLTRPEKANLPTVDSLKTLEKILPYGTQGLENFMQGFDYATSEKGLGMPVRQGIEFSLKLTEKTKN